MTKRRSRRIAKQDVPPDILQIIKRRVHGFQKARASPMSVITDHIGSSIQQPTGQSNLLSSAIDGPSALDPFPTSPMPDPVRLSGANDPLLLGSAFPFDRKLPIACQLLIPSTGIATVRHTLGPFNVVCSYCRALHWMEERLKKSSPIYPQFGMCCNSGIVSFPSFPDPPEPLLSFLDGRNMTAGTSL